MSSVEADDGHDLPPDHPRRLLLIASARLDTIAPAPNGMKCTTIAAFGDHAVRLIELASGRGETLSRTWVELYDAASRYTLDGAGCADLSEAVAATVAFLAEAKSLNARLSLCPERNRRRP